MNYSGIFEYEIVKNGHSILPGRYAGLVNITDCDSGIPIQTIITLCLAPLILMGCFGNALIFFVIINNKHLHTSINFYLLSQGVSDSMMFWSFLFNMIYCMNLSSVLPDTTVSLSSVLIKMMYYMGIRATIFIIVVIAFDRYIAICHPLMSSKLLTRRRTFKIILILWSLSFIFSLSFVLCVDIPTFKCSWSEIFYSIEFPIISTLPVVFIVIMYAMIGFKISKSSQIFKKFSNQNDSATENNCKRRGIDISVVTIAEYVICWVPMTFVVVLYTYEVIDMTLVYRNRIYLLVTVSLFIMSSVINPLIYTMMCLNFRKAFKDLLCCFGHQLCSHDED